jgi:DNA mismatch repair protein MutS2
MDRKHLNTLELPKILAQLARHTTFSGGKELAISLEPSPLFAEVQHRLQETREARYLLDSESGVTLGGVHDIRSLAHSATRGALLQPGDLLDIQDTLRAAKRVQRSLDRVRDQAPLLVDVASRIEPCNSVAQEIGRCISQQGEVEDHASAKLARTRREMRTAHERLLERLNRLVANPNSAAYLQDSLVTQRAGRYVIPVKADFRGRIPGIVHDSSASGATLFIEPLSVVQLGNRWRELQLEEEKEVERILAELSALVADYADELVWTVKALAELDLALAKGRYALAIDAHEPAMTSFRWEANRNPGSSLDLRQARHPLLPPDTVVPIDIHLTDEFFSIIITGPNTGGKTVSLKTVGLMAAMAQAGLHIPAESGSVLPMFEDIFADIGDEQSIEQSLSTFSSHLTNIVDILERATERSLVLLDELGAGTDPVEGSALARAILSHLLARKVTTFVATHYSELKAYAHTTDGIENASVEFDLETLAPTYRLRVGLPGRSNAFAIAERLGLSSTVVRTARALVSPEELETETFLTEIQEAHSQALVARDEAQLAQREVAEQHRRLSARLATIDGERAAILGEARAQARRELIEVRTELESIRAELGERRSLSSLGDEWLAQARARLEEKEEMVQPPPPPPPTEEMVLPGDIAVGDRVWVTELATTGEVTSIDGAVAEVQVGGFGVRVKQAALERRGRAEASEPDVAPALESFHESPGVELDLRGQRVDEIALGLDKYLDDAFLAGLPFVRIIHGKGTGALREAVQKQLHSHPLVRSYRAGEQGEGGSGATVAYLADG